MTLGVKRAKLAVSGSKFNRLYKIAIPRTKEEAFYSDYFVKYLGSRRKQTEKMVTKGDLVLTLW